MSNLWVIACALVRQPAAARTGLDGHRGRLLLVARGVERLRALGAVAVDRHRLGADPPRVDVGLLDLLDRRFLRHVDGLADRARQERLRRAHHLDVAHVVDRPHAARRLERAVEHRQVRVLDVRRPLDGLVLVDVLDDLLDLLRGVAQLLERHRHGLVDDLHQPAADQLLVLDQRDVRLDAGGVAVHHEADGAGRREHGRLRVAEAVLLAHLDRLRPTPSGPPASAPWARGSCRCP